jgi:hypothetical protein
MSRAYIVYILMFAILAGGLWVILTLGHATRAPDDLSGDWQVTWTGALPPGGDAPEMHIDQSGQFFEVRLGKRPPLSMKLRPGWKGLRDGPMLAMELDGQPWKMNISGKYPSLASWKIPSIEVELVGPTRHVGVARRVGVEPPTTRTAGAGVAHAR